MSKKVLSADNQQERVGKSLDPWYITGFVEGEGTFHIALYRDEHMRQGVKIIPEFHVNQSYLRLVTITSIKQYFGCGYIKANHPGSTRDTTYVYVVRDRNDLLKKIIPFFRRYPLQSIKQNSFMIFADIVERMARGEHYTLAGVKIIITRAYKMNAGGKYRQRTKQELFNNLQSSETIC